MDEVQFNRLIHTFKNDNKSFDEIYLYYFPRIKVFIGRKYGDSQLGEDIAQEFFMELFRTNIPEKIQFPNAWVFKFSDNLTKSYLAIKNLKRETPLDDKIFIDADADDVDDSLKNGGISEENINALKELDALTVEIFVMYFWEGYNYREISDILHINYALIRKKASRGIQKLKNFL